MSIRPEKCGINVEPPALVVTYVDESSGKKRRRSMPLRNFTAKSGVARVADELKSNPRHKKFLEQIQTTQIERLLLVVQERLRGASLDDALDKAAGELRVDPEEDLNGLDDEQLERKKRVMDESFEKNRKTRDDPDFVYEVEVDFDGKGGPRIESSGWDSGSESSELDF